MIDTIKQTLHRNSFLTLLLALSLPWPVLWVTVPSLFKVASAAHIALAVAAGLFPAWLASIIGRRFILRRFRKLSQSESQLLGLMRLSGDWYWEQDVEGRVVSLLPRSTPQAAAERGPTDFPILGHTRWDLAGLTPVDMDWDAFRRLMDDKKSFEKVRFLYTSAQGDRLYFVSSGVPRTDWKGRDLGYCGVSVNITDRCLNQNLKAAERQLLRGLMLGLPPDRLLGGFCTELANALHRVCDVYCWTQVADTVSSPSASVAADGGLTGALRLTAWSDGAKALPQWSDVQWQRDHDRLLADLPGACLEASQDSTQTPPLGFLLAVPRNQATLTDRDRDRFHDAGNLLMLVLERQHFERETLQFNSQLESRIAERTASLQQTNRELESFSYTVSHDLRAPLRAIDGFTNIILEDFEADLPPDAVQLLKRISNNATQMGKLIDGLLDFSRLLRNQPVQVEVNMNALVEQVCDTLNARARASVQVDDMPQALGDPMWFTQVWMNLIDNALKFSGKRAEPRVTIEAQQQADGVRFSVADNGAGFDPAYRDKLFNVFERLHHKKDFDGTGVGLAIVKRIIERHGGFVFAESVLGEGARFGFFLPWASLVHPDSTAAGQSAYKEGV